MSKTSTGINFLGIPAVLMYFEEVLKEFPQYRNNIISIGSGGGYIEKVIDSLLNTDIICIDPDPLSYIPDKVIYKRPKYGTVNDESFPLEKYNGKCILFINWSSPDQCNGYDIDAIMKLNPICIINITETGIYRGAGSIGFHEFLNFNNIFTQGVYSPSMDDFERPNILDFSDFRYHECSKTTCRYIKPGYHEELKYEIICLTKHNISIFLPNILKPYNSPENMTHNALNHRWYLIRNRWDHIVKNLNITPDNLNIISDDQKRKEIDRSWDNHIEEITTGLIKRCSKKSKKNKKK